MQQTINVDSSAVIESVTAEIYSVCVEMKTEFKSEAQRFVEAEMLRVVAAAHESIARLVDHGKSELKEASNEAAREIEARVATDRALKIVEDKADAVAANDKLWLIYADMKADMKAALDESVKHGKSELVAETSLLFSQLDEMVLKIVEDKVNLCVNSALDRLEAKERAMEVEAVKTRLDSVSNKPWWKWW